MLLKWLEVKFSGDLNTVIFHIEVNKRDYREIIVAGFKVAECICLKASRHTKHYVEFWRTFKLLEFELLKFKYDSFFRKALKNMKK